MIDVEYCAFCGSTDIVSFRADDSLDDVVVECDDCDEHYRVISWRFDGD